MQAWNVVKVTNPDSEFVGQAGTVTGVVTKGKKTTVTVRLDVDGEEHEFAETDLQLLA